MITPDDVMLMKAVLLYIVKNSKPAKRDVYCIVKTAYYEQQFHMVECMCPAYNDPIVAMDFGPVPSVMYNILKCARGEREVLRFYPDLADAVESAAGALGYRDGRYCAREEPDMDYLSASAVECLDRAIAKVGGMTFYDIIHDTHDGEWRRAYYDSADRQMSYLAIAREGGADGDLVDYMAEHLLMDRRYSQLA